MALAGRGSENGVNCEEVHVNCESHLFCLVSLQRNLLQSLAHSPFLLKNHVVVLGSSLHGAKRFQFMHMGTHTLLYFSADFCPCPACTYSAMFKHAIVLEFHHRYYTQRGSCDGNSSSTNKPF